MIAAEMPLADNRPAGAKGKGISGTGLKYIALITMLIDHIGAVILEPYCMNQIPEGMSFDQEVMTPWMTEHIDVALLFMLMLILRLIGRVAFPIFAFLITEGFTHTRNVYKYAANLLVFAAVSEIPYNLSRSGCLIHLDHQSVYMTLLLGLICIFVVSKIEPLKGWYKLPLVFLSVASFAIIAEFLRTDYGSVGVLTIVAMYMLRKKKVIAFAVGCAILLLANFSEITAFFALIPIFKYNGEKGHRLNKYVYYFFYPVHLGVLYLISFAVGGLGFSVMSPVEEPEILPGQETSIEKPVEELKLNTYSETLIPTAIVKIGDEYFIDDCYHDQIIYTKDLSKPLTEWQILADEGSCGIKQSHTLAGDGAGNIVVDDTENNRVLVFDSAGGGHKLTQIYNNMGNRPHFTVYHPETDTFYVLSSCSGELFMFKHRESDGKLYHADTRVFEELRHIYVRSFAIDGDNIIFVSGLATDEENTQKPAILVYDLNTFEKKNEYSVPDSMAGMVQVAHIGSYYYVTVSTDLYGDKEVATILEAKDLAAFQYDMYEDIYSRYFEKGGTPYFIGKMEDEWYMTEHRSDKCKIWKLFTESNGKITGAEVIH